MLIKILKNCATASHTLKKDDIVNMRKADAERLIAKKLAKKPTKADIEKIENSEKEG